MIQELASQSTEQNSLGLAQTLYEQMKRNLGIDASQLSQNAVETAESVTAGEYSDIQ
jgi:Rod binding domain-containing protein